MCDPISGAFMVMQAAGAYSASAGNKAAYNAQAQVAQNNAQIAEWQAEDAVHRGADAAEAQGYKTSQLKGAQRARLAANGVDLGVGSAQQVLTDTDYFGAIDRNRIVDNAAREAWGYRNQAANSMSNSSLLRSRANAEHPLLAAGASLLTTATKASGSWYTGTPSVTDGGYSVGVGSAYGGSRRGL
jgi:hypothetical protein